MASKKTTKVKKKRKLNPIVRLLCLIFIGISAWLLYNVGNEILTTMKLRDELAEVQEKLQEVQDHNNYLVKEKDKLMNPDYVESYARSNYMLSKGGEQIFYLPEDENK